MSKEMRNMINNFKRLLIESEENYLLTEGYIDTIKEYIQKTEYDILNSWGNCAFYTKDFIEKMGGNIIYMPLANPKGEDPEDHIVPVVNNVIIDFAYVPEKGVSKHDRTTGNPPKFNPGVGDGKWPRLTKVTDQIFEENGVYGKLGYLKNSKYATEECNLKSGLPKGCDWVYGEYPQLKDGKYPIYLKNLPSYVTIEPPIKKNNKSKPLV